MLEVIGYYLCFTIFIIQPVEEIYTCNHPNTIGSGRSLLCDWEDDDFINFPNGERRLRKKRKADSQIKAYYRSKYHKDRKWLK